MIDQPTVLDVSVTLKDLVVFTGPETESVLTLRINVSLPSDSTSAIVLKVMVCTYVVFDIPAGIATE